MQRSRKLTLSNWTQANDALNQYFAGNKSELAKHLGMSRTTVTAFFKQEAIREAEFRKICLDLQLNWQLVSEVRSSAPQSQQETAEKPAVLPSDNDFEALVQQVREHCREKILSQHSRMRLLSGEEIGVDQLYVDVWVLNRPLHTFQVSQSKLLETFDLRNDWLGLGDRIRRNPGFEVANEKSKLVILGKPGSGKTTFLKHLAVDWCKGQFQPDLITVLIEFRQVRGEQWYLLDAIGSELGLNDGYQLRSLKEQIEVLKKEPITPEEAQKKEKQIDELQQQLNALPLQVFLAQGKLLVLMDGLDEAPTNALRSAAQRQLYAISEEYSKNRFLLTCRTQIMTSTLIGFTSVEIADFSSERVQQFVQNWFMANGKSDAEAAQQWKALSNAVNNHPPLKELTVTPVVLSLMCLVLQDEGKIPSEITWLCQKGIKLLLSRWNEDKQINEWEIGSEIYRRLSVEQKEELLIEIAARKFENPKNFVLFEQEEIADQITRFLKLANREEGVAVLKAIEAQHGLLIERADELWSFSYLTFQEYFTVQWLTQLSSEELAEKIESHQWQEVVKQLVRSQQPADRLLRLIKQAIDRSIAHNLVTNEFLTWVFEKAQSTQAHYKPAAIRAFYFAFALALALDPALDFALDLDLALDLDRALDLTLDPALAYALDLDRARAHALDLAHYIPELVDQLKQLRADLPKDLNGSFQWNKAQWIVQLRQVMIEHRNIGHDWQFTNAQKQQLQHYYDANKFLVDLMNIEGVVSNDVRDEIEGTLLLPWDELQRRQPDVTSSLVNVFISYSSEDQDLQEELERHLANLKRHVKIQAWHRGKIEAGAEWDTAIKDQLETAQIILLLISSNFIASDYCYDHQLQRALQRHNAGTAQVIPIILRPTDWQNSAFSRLSPLPTDGRAITLWENRDEAFVNVVAGIRDAIERGFS